MGRRIKVNLAHAIPVYGHDAALSKTLAKGYPYAG